MSAVEPSASAKPFATSGTIADPRTSRNAYSFTGTKGQALQIVASTGAADPFDATALDLVITVYDPNQQLLATQDDPWPRTSKSPTLYTLLPATGTYFIRVENCYSFYVTGCRNVNLITNKTYTIRVAELSGPTLIREGAELYQLFDSWAGELTLAEYDQWAQPFHREILAGATGVPSRR